MQARSSGVSRPWGGRWLGLDHLLAKCALAHLAAQSHSTNVTPSTKCIPVVQLRTSNGALFEDFWHDHRLWVRTARFSRSSGTILNVITTTHEHPRARVRGRAAKWLSWFASAWWARRRDELLGGILCVVYEKIFLLKHLSELQKKTSSVNIDFN
jgi:hypothetical protein